ncbi:MAG TPA: heme-binding protein [Burkholderiales bacterium]|nr:heme-binding protein [Burkholderiales bacterium]
MQKKVLTLEMAKRIAAAAETKANANQWKAVIAVVDDGGHLVYLQRTDDTQFGSVEVAIGKAYSAIAFKRPTKGWEERLAEGRLGFLSLPGKAVLLEGGLPLSAEGQVIGAIGVSGVQSSEDAQIAAAGAAAL